MTSGLRRSTRSRSSLNVKFADDPDYDEQVFEDDQGDDDDDDLDELPVARVKQEQQRHTNQNTTNNGIVKRRRGRPSKREAINDDDEDDDEWHAEQEEDFSTVTPIDVTLSSSGPDGNASVYEFSEVSNRKKLPAVDSFGNNISRDSTKTPIKVRRDEKHLCPYWYISLDLFYECNVLLFSLVTIVRAKNIYCNVILNLILQNDHINVKYLMKQFLV